MWLIWSCNCSDEFIWTFKAFKNPCKIKKERKLELCFDKHIIYWTAQDTFGTPEWGRTQKGKICGRYVIQWSFSSLHRRCPSAFESKTKWQSGEWQAAQANCYTGCRSWTPRSRGSVCVPSAVRSPLSRFVHQWHIPSSWPVLCLFPRNSLFPRSLLASERRLLAEIHVAQKARAFQLSVSNP